MADLYDEQFKRRLAMHVLVCDSVSADIIKAMQRYLEAERTPAPEAPLPCPKCGSESKEVARIPCANSEVHSWHFESGVASPLPGEDAKHET